MTSVKTLVIFRDKQNQHDKRQGSEWDFNHIQSLVFYHIGRVTRPKRSEGLLGSN